MRQRAMVWAAIVSAVLVVGNVQAQTALGTAFTYQGQLKKAGAPVDGWADFVFRLYDGDPNGVQVGPTLTFDGLGGNPAPIDVNKGLFTAWLDFGPNAFTGQARWLAIAVRSPSGSGVYTALSPRQELTPTPYALALPGVRTEQNATSPNVIGGYSGNWVDPNVVGATIAGGGGPVYQNRVRHSYGAVGGGRDNQAGPNDGTGAHATVGGGFVNEATGDYSTVAGGEFNVAAGSGGMVGGGDNNDASGNRSVVVGGLGNQASALESFVGGGQYNQASQVFSAVVGGYSNVASGGGSVVAGGGANTASGADSIVAGGENNVAEGYWSFAAGRSAGAHQDGTFVWADASDPNNSFASTHPNQFLVRAAGGVGIGTNAPTSPLTVNGAIESKSAGFKFPDGTTQTAAAVTGWKLTGNAGTDPNVNFLGTTDNTPLVVKVNGTEHLRVDPNTNVTTETANFQPALSALGNTPVVSLPIVQATNYGTGTAIMGTAPVVYWGPTDISYGGYFTSAGAYGRGVCGTATAIGGPGMGGLDAANYGGYFTAAGNKGTAVYASATYGGDPNDVSYGVYANCTAGNGYAGYFTGRGYFSGNVGAGVTDPSERLDSSGTARLRGIAAGSGTTVVADAGGKLWKSSSSRRYKHNVADLPAAADPVLDLRPVTFQWNSTGEPDIGLVAEDVATVLPDLVICDADGQPDAVKYDKIALYLLGVVKSQQQQIAALRCEKDAQTAAVQERNDKLEQRLAAVENTVAKLTQEHEGDR